MRRLLFVLSCLFHPLQAFSAAESVDGAVAEVIIVGTYHFSNPGQDQHNVVADDVLAPERQQQLERIATHLQRFRPTLVAVEWPKDLVNERYTGFLAGTLAPSRNEVVQLGFRLARLAGLRAVHGIDVDGEFPFEPVQAWAEKHGMADRLVALSELAQASVERITTLQREGSIGDALREMNRPERIVQDHAFYAELPRFGSGDEQPGAALLSAWNTRNVEICARLVQVLKPGDRAVVFYGAGHSFLLRQCVSQSPGLKLVEANAYLP